MTIQRDIFQKIINALELRKIIILQGPRQVGKTTIMKIIQALQINTKTVFLYCDDQQFSARIRTAKDLLQYLSFEYGYQEGEEIFVFLDEFQSITESGMFLKNIYDAHPNIHLICSGSSSLEITKNSEFLTGRKIIFDITPFSFREYLRVQNVSVANTVLSLNQREQCSDFYTLYGESLQKHFENYLSIGGYPEIVTSQGENRQMIAKDILETYISKDITAFLKIENITAFNHLIRIVSSQIGNLVNKNELTTTIGISINTLNKYVDILEGTFVIDLIRPFFSNIRKEISKMPKVYFHDTGMRNFLLYGSLQQFPVQDAGSLVENFVYTHLKNNESIIKTHFYRTISKQEIDFIVQKQNGEITPIEVKYRNGLPPASFFSFFQKEYQNAEKPVIISKNECTENEHYKAIPACIFGLLE